MGAVWLLARADVRRHRATLLWLGLLMGLVGAAVLAPVIGARRTATAYDRLLDETGAPDFSVSLIGRPGVGTGLQALPEVESSWPAYIGVAQQLGRADVRYLSVTFGPPRPPGLFEPLVRDGRLPHPDAVDEVLLNETFAEVAGIRLGDRLELKFLTQEEFFNFGQFGGPDGPLVALNVVGLGRYPLPDNNALGTILATPAFDAIYRDRVGGGDALLGNLRAGEGGVAELQANLDRLVADDAVSVPVDDQFTQARVTTPAGTRATVADTTEVLVTGLLAFAAAAGVAGMIALGLALGRHHARVSEDSMRLALGLTRGQRVLALALPLTVSGLIAGPVAVAVAVAVSPLSPNGSIAQLEPAPGVGANVAFLAAGALVVAVAVATLTLAAGTAWLRVGRTRGGAVGQRLRRSDLATLLANLGAGPPATVGTRLASRRRPPGCSRAPVPGRGSRRDRRRGRRPGVSWPPSTAWWRRPPASVGRPRSSWPTSTTPSTAWRPTPPSTPWPT